MPLNLPGKRSDLPLSKGRQSLVGLTCLRHGEEEVSAQGREGSAGLVFLFCYSYPSCALAKPGCLAPGGCELQAKLGAVSMAVGRRGLSGMRGQVAGAGSPAPLLAASVWKRPRPPSPRLCSSWSSGYCLYGSELCVREL